MNVPPAKLLVWVDDRQVCVKVIGRANFVSGPDLQRLVDELQARGYRRFLIDASECAVMDSTFLGVLCGLGLKLKRAAAGDPGGVEVFNPNPRLAEMIETLGATDLLHITAGPVPLPGTSRPAVPETTAPTAEEIARTSVDAHRILMSLKPENVALFKDVVQFMAEDLQRLKPSGT